MCGGPGPNGGPYSRGIEMEERQRKTMGAGNSVHEAALIRSSKEQSRAPTTDVFMFMNVP